LRKFALLVSACTVLLFANFAAAQQVDIMVGGSTLMSPYSPSDLVNFQPPIERGGTYVGISGDYIKFKHRLGLNVETAWRYHQTNYAGYETYRPILTDVNALFQPKLSKKVGLEFMAGIGVASTRFNLTAPCSIPGCTNYTSSNHFMEDIGVGGRYYVWHRLPHVFVRPEAHYYHIQNNVEFHSDNVFRVGASVGYTFGNN
jgi:hypothetical protein